MLDYPKVEIQPFKKGGKIRKQKQKQKQTQKQIVNVNIGRGVKKSYTRRSQQPQQQKNMMYYPPPMTTIIQNPNQPQQLPDITSLLNLFRLQGSKTQEQKTVNELRLENLEKRNLITTTNEEKKSLKDDDKPYIPPEEEKYLDFIDDDARNANIRNAPISNPLLDNNSLPSLSLSLNSDNLSSLAGRPLPPIPKENTDDYETYPSVNQIRELAKNYTKRPLTIAKAKEEILLMDVGYTEKMLNKLSSSELNYLLPYIKSSIKDINRGEGQKAKGRPRTKKNEIINV